MSQKEHQQSKSVLEMQNLYFSNIIYENQKCVSNIDLRINYNIKYDFNEQKDQAKITIDTHINDESKLFNLELKAVGLFKLLNNKLQNDIELKTLILKKNTVAIMFPFIRSQISLITTQPGIKPIMLQPIDINTLIKE